MSSSGEMPWSDDPNAPLIPYWVYLGEKAIFVGLFIGSILFGISITLFFQCAVTLLDPVNRTKGSIKWGLVAHTLAMFSLLTIAVAAHLSRQSISYIDNREFPGQDVYPPGPFGYQYFTNSVANVISGVAFPLNQWLVDGFLLYRCHVIYSMNPWVIAFPSLMYLATVAMGIMNIWATMQPEYLTSPDIFGNNVVISYYSISLLLNALLTSMIVTRLVLHSKNIRSATGDTAGTSGVYRAIITTLVESSALYTVAFLVYIGPWAAHSYLESVFSAVLGAVQVIAPFLITIRVASRRALTNEMISSGGVGSIHFRSQGRSTNGENTGELGVGTEDTIQEVPL